ncbi:MAG: adenosyl-hopene transferase HpnH [Pseudomonadota bacterium]
MSVPIFQQAVLGAYILRQRLMGRKRYPLVLMLEPLFQCNLACAGCGKIDYPTDILRQRMSLEECLEAVDECGAPMVAIPGGEPLIHKEIHQIVAGIVARGKFVSLCTNAVLLEKHLDRFTPSRYLTFTIHLDGLKDHHDRSVCRDGVFDKAMSAIKAAQAKGFNVSANCTVFQNHPVEDLAAFLDECTAMNVGVALSPGFAYERAPDQENFMRRRGTKGYFRDLFSRNTGRRWSLINSPLYLDFLAGNQEYMCSPWGMPARNVFGWQRPCYLLGEGYASSFKELMETTDWDSYGTGRYEKCADCMAHCGYEPTAANDALRNPLKMFSLTRNGPRTTGAMAREIDLSKQRPAEEHHDRLVSEQLDAIVQAEGEQARSAKKRRVLIDNL